MNFYEKYFLINLKDYPNIGINFEINKILLFLAIGIIIAAVAVNYRKASMTLVIKGLLRHKARDEESAKSLGELKISSLGARLALNGSGRLAGIVKRVGANKYTYEEYIELTKKRGYKEERIDFESAKFYIADEKYEEAKKIFERSDGSLVHTILFCVFIIAIYICLLFAMPGILDFVNALFTK